MALVENCAVQQALELIAMRRLQGQSYSLIIAKE